MDRMYGIRELKEELTRPNNIVECPVRGCKRSIQEGRFICPDHNITVTPSRFIYADERDNFLWTEDDDNMLLDQIKEVKSESERMSYNNSEDAVSWNVFRYLEKNNLISGYLANIIDSEVVNTNIIYWSYNQEEINSWSRLNMARTAFGETGAHRSEPDIIINTDRALFFIEAKYTSSNETSGSGKELQRHLDNPKEYITGENNWFSKVFMNDYRNIVMDQKYELMRFWLMGTWIAKKTNKDFYLINLVLSEKENDIEQEFGKHIRGSGSRVFKRCTWEKVYEYILSIQVDDQQKSIMMEYFKNRSLSYTNNVLVKAFNI